MSRRRTVAVLLALTCVGWLARRGSPRDGAATEGAPTIGVTARGFAVLRTTGAGRHGITELASDGRVQRELVASGISAQVRVVATAAGTTLFWLDGERQLRVTAFDGRGRRHDEAPRRARVKRSISAQSSLASR